MTSSAEPRPLHRWGRLALGLLLAWSLACRLLYGSVGLDESRFWDERYSLENVRHILETGRIEPVSGWYPVPSYLPHALLLAVAARLAEWGGRDELVVVGEGRFTSTAYLLCRSLQALFGTTSLFLLFLLVRRVGDWPTALLAVLFLATTPNHLRLSVILKPDALLLCANLLAALVAVRLVERERRRAARPLDARFLGRAAAAGAVVALAASANLNGVLAAVPVALALVLAGGSWGRRLAGLAAAALASAALFFVANPSWRLQLSYLERIRRQYREQSVGEGHLDVVVGGVQKFFEPAFFGASLGALGLLGLVALARTAVLERDRRRVLAVALVFPVAFFVAFAVATTYAKENHFLQVAPWVAWGAAFVMVGAARLLWRSTARPGGLRAVRLGVAAGAVALVSWLLAGSSRLVYETKVPTTASLLAQRLRPRLDPLAWRLVHVEAGEHGFRALTRWRDRAATEEVASLLEVAEDELRLGDGAVLPARRLEGARGESYRELLAGLAPEPWIVERPRLGRVRGPAVVAVLYPWIAAGDVAMPLRSEAIERRDGDGATAQTPPASALVWSAVLPEEGGAVRSLRVWLPRYDSPPHLEIGGRSTPLRSTRGDGRRDRYLSPRLRDPGGKRARLVLPAPLPPGEEPVLEVRTWTASR